MSSSSGTGPPGEDGVGDEPAQLDSVHENGRSDGSLDGTAKREHIVELLEEEKAGASTPLENGFRGQGYSNVQEPDQASEDGSLEIPSRRVESPSRSVLSTPDDTPSVQVNVQQPEYWPLF